MQLLKELGHQHGILAAGNAHGDAVAALHQLVIAHGLREVAPQLFAELFAQTVLYALAQLVGLLALHLIAQPFDIAALEAVRVDALLPQRLGRVQTELAVRAVEDELLSVRLGRIGLQLLLHHRQCVRNHAVLARLLAAHVDQYIVLRRKPPHLFNRNFHVRFLMLSSINCPSCKPCRVYHKTRRRSTRIAEAHVILSLKKAAPEQRMFKRRRRGIFSCAVSRRSGRPAWRAWPVWSLKSGRPGSSPAFQRRARSPRASSPPRNWRSYTSF